MKTKITILTLLLILIGLYIGWIFYMSEPKYIDNAKALNQNQIEKYDVVNTYNDRQDVCIGMVIQIDSNFKNETRAIIKNFEHPYSNDAFTIAHLRSYSDSTGQGYTQDYRIIGKGTFYHKVNHFIGFNIMMTTTFLLIILEIVIGIVLIGLIREIMGFSSLFD